jgi:serine/threonine protein kinase
VLAVGLVCLCVLAVVAVLGGIAVASRARRGVWWWQEPRASWEIDLADLEIAELIGQGAMGKVYKAHYDDRLVAVKIVSETAMGARAFKEEIVTMMDFKHLNVMTPLCACVSGPRLALVMPFMELGSVYDLVHNEMLVVIPAGLRARMLFDVAKGMNYLHNAGIVHRDLKSPNLLVQKDWTVRITDFGLAMRVRAHRRAHALSEPEIEDVSTSWAAPEVLIDSNVATTEADVYSFGIIMWELLERAKPYGDAAQAAIAVAVSVHHRRPVLSPENQQTDDERLKKYIDLMRDCWSTEPEKRPTFAEVSTRIAVAYPAEEREGRSGRSSLLRGGAVSGGANDTATSRSLSDGASDVGSAHTLDGGGAGGDHDGARRHVRRAIESLYGAHDGDGARGHRGAGTNDNDDDDLASDTSTTTTDGEADPAATGAGVRTRRRGWRGKPLARPLEHGAAHLAAPLDRHNPLLLSPEDADDHSAVFVIADIAHNSDIWEADPYVARDATLLFLETARRLGRKHRATESKSPLASSLGTICLAFRGAPAAVGWASALQQELLRVAWDDKLLRIDAAGEVAHGMDDRIIYKGLRVRMGIETGEYRRIDGDMPGAVRFTGPALVRAASACTMADGGQILMGRTCYTAWASGLLRAGRSLFSLRQPQALEPHYIEVVPAGLEERYFGESRPIDIDGDTAPSRVKSERNDHSDSDSDLDSSVSSVSTALDDPPTRVGSDPLAQLSATRGLRWLLQFNDSVELQDELGVGSYGVVYRARWNHQHPAAFKRLLRQVASEVNLLNFIADAGVLFLLEPHPNIVVQLGACIEPPNMGVLTGLSDRGPLSTVLYDVKHRLRFKTKVAMLADVARGLAFLHEHDIVHRHVSPHNLLVDADWRVRISDAGFHQARSEGAMATRCGAPLWTPPELFMMSGQLGAPEDRDDENAAGDGDDGDNRAPHTLPASRRDKPRSRASASDLLKRIDIYALGIVMWEVYMRRQPYQGKPAMELALQIPKGLRPDVPSRCPEVYADLMTRCWSSDPAARPSSSDALHALEAIVHSLPAGQTWDPTDDSELSV